MKINVTELNMAVRSLLIEATTPKELDEISHAIRRIVENLIDEAYEKID